MDNESIPGNAIDPDGAPALTYQDRLILDNVESALVKGLQLQQWWKQTDAANSYADRFETVCTFNRPDHSFAFFDQVQLNGRTLPVLGDVMDLFYDRPKAPPETGAAAWMRDQLREFILRYFMRVSDSRRPQAYIRSERPGSPPLLRPFSWCPTEDPTRQGFGYAQMYYKLRESGRIGKFPEAERFAILDVRELLQKYEWMVLRIRIFDFNLAFRPFGSNLPQVDIPFREQQWVVMSRDFILDESNPEPGVLGKYGYGYAVLKAPTDLGLLAYGPGQFEAGFQLFNFRVLDSGEVRAKLVFVVNRPERILNLSLNPLTWGFMLTDLAAFGAPSGLFAQMQGVLNHLPFGGGNLDPVFGSIDLINLSTGGLAARELCISREDLEKDMLVQHFMQNYDLIVGSLLTWRQIPNWLDSTTLPQWVVSGISS